MCRRDNYEGAQLRKQRQEVASASEKERFLGCIPILIVLSGDVTEGLSA